jgi:hypothetical protein
MATSSVVSVLSYSSIVLHPNHYVILHMSKLPVSTAHMLTFPNPFRGVVDNIITRLMSRVSYGILHLHVMTPPHLTDMHIMTMTRVVAPIVI